MAWNDLQCDYLGWLTIMVVLQRGTLTSQQEVEIQTAVGTG